MESDKPSEEEFTSELLFTPNNEAKYIIGLLVTNDVMDINQ